MYIKANSCVCGYPGADFIHQRFVAFIEAFPKFLVEENGLDKSWFSIAFQLFLLYFFPILFPMTRSKYEFPFFFILLEWTSWIYLDTFVIVPRSDKLLTKYILTKLKAIFVSNEGFISIRQ